MGLENYAGGVLKCSLWIARELRDNMVGIMCIENKALNMYQPFSEDTSEQLEKTSEKKIKNKFKLFYIRAIYNFSSLLGSCCIQRKLQPLVILCIVIFIELMNFFFCKIVYVVWTIQKNGNNFRFPLARSGLMRFNCSRFHLFSEMLINLSENWRTILQSTRLGCGFCLSEIKNHVSHSCTTEFSQMNNIFS